MRKALLLSTLLLPFMACFSQSGSVIINSVSQRSDESGLVDVHYDLSGAQSDYYVNMRVSFNEGLNFFPISPASMSGDVGPVSPGTSKHIVWNPTIDHPNRYSPQAKLLVVAYHINNSNFCPGTPTVTDYDGNVYATVQIGDQCWMASNLNSIRNAAGNSITRKCYADNPVNCEYYGGLYSWATVMNGASSSNSNPSGVQGICPNGWHVPGDAEWTQLTGYLISTYVDVTSSNVGNRLKSCRQLSSPLGNDCNTSDHPRWNSNATHYGTNDFGFSALPGGFDNLGSFGSLGAYGYWWSAMESTSGYAWYRSIYSGNGNVSRNNTLKTTGHSLRCLKD
ncbi:MAG: hypothetical protein IH597_07285 [Bacteroidales bacterium]|nr:hypothetical protein [Bacteroidales bacterium]